MHPMVAFLWLAAISHSWRPFDCSCRASKKVAELKNFQHFLLSGLYVFCPRWYQKSLLCSSVQMFLHWLTINFNNLVNLNNKPVFELGSPEDELLLFSKFSTRFESKSFFSRFKEINGELSSSIPTIILCTWMSSSTKSLIRVDGFGGSAW